MSLLYKAINKPWEWRSHLTEYRARRERQWELVDFFHGQVANSCRACLAQRHPGSLGSSRICGPCWRILEVPFENRTPRQHIRFNRMNEYFIGRGIGALE
jgi:hypothetical protein